MVSIQKSFLILFFRKYFRKLCTIYDLINRFYKYVISYFYLMHVYYKELSTLYTGKICIIRSINFKLFKQNMSFQKGNLYSSNPQFLLVIR